MQYHYFLHISIVIVIKRFLYRSQGTPLAWADSFEVVSYAKIAPKIDDVVVLEVK